MADEYQHRVLCKGLRWNGNAFRLDYDQIDEANKVIHSFGVKANKSDARRLGYIFAANVTDNAIQMPKKPEALLRWTVQADLIEWTAKQNLALKEYSKTKFKAVELSEMRHRLQREIYLFKKMEEKGDWEGCKAMEELVIDMIRGNI